MADFEQRNPWPIVAKLVGVLFLVAILACAAVLPYLGSAGLLVNKEASKFLSTKCNLDLNAIQPPTPSVILASDNKTVIAKVFSQDRDPVPLSQIPVGLQKALVATEDRRFYQHHGVDMRGLIRSAFSTSNGDTQGGSTLTMQYVKQVRYYNDIGNPAAQQADISQNLNRKMEDAQCALALERRESKNDILDDYLNIAFFGENSYSIAVAAQTYFGKPISQLTLPESALLVGLLQAPTQYDPFQDLAAATARRNQVLQNLVSVKYINQAQAQKYAAEPIHLATKGPPEVQQGCAGQVAGEPANAQFFCDYVVSWLQNTQGINLKTLQTQGLRIRTTLNASLQNSVQQNLWTAMPATSTEAAVMPVVNPANGQILAMATNRKYGNPTSAKDVSHTTLPLFTAATASGASTWKLFSLLTALNTGVPSNWSTDTYTPSVGSNPPGYLTQNCYGNTKPAQNDTNSPVSWTRNQSMDVATAESSNTFFVAMDDKLFHCQLNPIVKLATSMGMTSLNAVDPTGDGKSTLAQDIVNDQSVFQLALGSGMPTSPLQLVGAYGTVANAGVYVAPHPILSITDESGQSIAAKGTAPVRVLQPQVAAQAEAILSGDSMSANGTSHTEFQSWYAAHPGLVVASKTGTAVAEPNEQQNSALWYVGITPNLAAATAIFNPAHSSAAITSLPNVSPANAPITEGDYAAGVWLKSLQSYLGTQSWSWPNPNDTTAFGPYVTNVVGQPVAQATATLQAQGYKVVQLDPSIQCASSQPIGSVAFVGPSNAQPQSTVTICPSNGSGAPTYTAPAPPPPPPASGPPAGGASSPPARGSHPAPPPRRTPPGHPGPTHPAPRTQPAGGASPSH